MGLFDLFGSQQHYDDIYQTDQVQPHHQSSWTHEAVAGAAGFAAMRAYESHLRATGQQPSHEMMKEILAGIAAAEVDKLAETKGLDWIDRRRAKEMAVQQAHHLARERYQGGSGYEYAMGSQGPAYQYDYNGGAPFGAPGCPSYGYGAPGGYEQPQGYGYSNFAPPPGPPQGGYYGNQPPQGYGGQQYGGGYDQY